LTKELGREISVTDALTVIEAKLIPAIKDAINFNPQVR
jgi:hypothetical protein